jgi:hypothetical protein
VGGPVGGSGVLPFFNPAFFALPFAPLSYLDLLPAFQVWTLLLVVLLVVDAAMVLALARELPARWRLACVTGFITMVPVSYGLQHGQFSLLLLTSWGAAFLLLRAGRDAWAGVALAPLLIKPELVIPVALYLCWKRRLAVFHTLVPLTVAALLLSVAITGLPAALGYVSFLIHSTEWEGHGVTTSVMFGWNGIVATFVDEPASLAARACVVALSLVTAAALYTSLRGRIDDDRRSFAVHWTLLTIATVLLDPHLYLQDTILLALPAVALLAAMAPARRAELAAALAAGWLLLALGNAPTLYAGVNLFALYMLGAGCVLAWFQLRQAPRTAPAGSPARVPATA